MKKKIATALIVLLGICLGIVTFLLFNLSKVEMFLEQSLETDNRFHNNIIELDATVSELEKTVSSTFIKSREDDLSQNLNEIDRLSTLIATRIKELRDPKFSKLLNQSIEDPLELNSEAEQPAPPENEQSPQKQTSDLRITTFDKLLGDLEAETIDVKSNSSIVGQSTLDAMKVEKKLQTSLKNLSKKFRKIDFEPHLEDRKSKKELSNLTRAVMIVMYSKSVRDLNFAGRKKFESSTKFWDEKLGNNNNYKKFKEIFSESFDLAINRSANSSEEAFFKFRQGTFSFLSKLKTLKASSDSLFAKSQRSLVNEISNTRQLSIYFSIVAILIGSFFSLITINKLTRAMNEILKRVAETTKSVAQVSRELNFSSEDLKTSAKNGAIAIETTASSTDEISSMVNQNLEKAKRSEEISQEFLTVAHLTKNHVAELEQAMDNIAISNEEIRKLSEIVAEIGEKTKVIDDIVFQTKLLSFNAAVESERAGEHGRGFAVVAAEVGNLARMSGQAATEIEEIVLMSVKSATEISRENTEKVEHSKVLVEQLVQKSKEIEDGANNLTKESRSILNASKEQSNGIDQVSLAMVKLDEITQSNLQNANSTYSSSIQLLKRAEELENSVADMNKIVTGKNQIKPEIEDSTPNNKPSKNQLESSKIQEEPEKSFKIAG